MGGDQKEDGTGDWVHVDPEVMSPGKVCGVMAEGSDQPACRELSQRCGQTQGMSKATVASHPSQDTQRVSGCASEEVGLVGGRRWG